MPASSASAIVGDVHPVGIADDEVNSALDQEPDVVGMDSRIWVGICLGRDDGPDLRVGEGLEDGLHVAHRTPDVPVPAAIGITHHHFAAGPGVTLPLLQHSIALSICGLIGILVGPGDEARMMFSSPHPTAPRGPGPSIRAGSASVLSPNSASAPLACGGGTGRWRRWPSSNRRRHRHTRLRYQRDAAINAAILMRVACSSSLSRSPPALGGSSTSHRRLLLDRSHRTGRSYV